MLGTVKDVLDKTETIHQSNKSNNYENFKQQPFNKYIDRN